MLSDAGKLLGRDFVVGYFVPAFVFVASNMGLLGLLGIPMVWLQVDLDEPLKDTTFLAIVILVLSFCLMAVNRPVFRMLEGYWVFGLGRRLAFLPRWRFRRLQTELRLLTIERDESLKRGSAFLNRKRRNKLALRAAHDYPSTEDSILFTAFGNCVGAFEDYPRVMYGFEPIGGWARLNAVMPKDYREALGNRRALTDLWVNMWFLSLVLMAEFIALSNWHAGLERLWIPDHAWIIPAAALVALLAAWRARIAAKQWGEWVKAGFDLFLPALCEQLGHARPLTAQSERQFWDTFSKAIVFRHVGSLSAMDPSRVRTTVSAADRRFVTGSADADQDG